MEIVNCGIHGFHETLGIDEDELYFHWALSSTDYDIEQTAYQVVLSNSARHDTPQIWDTGKVDSKAQRNISCKLDGGFESTTSYYWRVTVWDQHGKTYHSSANHFFTAYPRSHRLPPYSMNQTYMPHTSLIFRSWFEDEPNRWKGVWIGDGSDKPLYVRKTLSLERKPARAIMFASGLGHFNLRVNGKAASESVLDPGWTNYHRTVQFVAYDLTAQLSSGANAIGAHIGNGFYAGDQGDRFFWPNYEDQTYVRHGNELCFFAELHLFGEDGSHQTIISGEDWKVRQSATTLANIYASEDHDRRAYPTGWDTPSFDDSTWQAAKPVTGPRGELKYQHQPPVTLHETFEPISTKTLKPGVVAFDLGQNSSIMVKIAVKGGAGSEVIVRYAETVDDQGYVLMPDPLFKQFETHVYSKFVLAGTGEMETWQPDFSFTSARYIQVEGVALESGHDLPVIHSAVGQHVSTAAKRLGSLTTDKEDVNQLINACYWSFTSNLFSYHTDCPQIEKFGWLEVTHLLVPATQYIRDIESLHSKILEDIIDAQEPSGFIPNMAPDTRFMCGPMRNCITWSCAICFIPEILKTYYGSTHMIKRVYPAAVKYIEYMQTWERKGGLIMHGLGDWGRDIAFGNLQANIETAVYYKCLQCLEMMASELELPQDVARFRAWSARIYKVYNDNLLVINDTSRPGGGAYYTSLDNYPTKDCISIAQAIALQFQLVPPEHRSAVSASFLSSPDITEGVMRSGEIGLRFLFNTLSDLRRPDIVLKMARQEEHPSYMRFLRRGETTLLEFWQDDCRSKCHDMLGTVYEWMYNTVLGVTVIEDAYRRWRLRPCWEGEFGEVQGSVDCPYGMIEVHTRDVDGSWRVEVTVPMSTTCRFELPENHGGVRVERLGNGMQEVDQSAAHIELTPGKYTIVAARAALNPWWRLVNCQASP